MDMTQRQLESFFAIAWEAGRLFQKEYGCRGFLDTAAFYKDFAERVRELADSEGVDDDEWYEFIDREAGNLYASADERLQGERP